MYEQIAANKRRSALLIFGFVLLVALVGLRLQLPAQRRRRRLRDRGGDRDRLVVGLVLQQRQGRARDEPRQAGRSRTVRAATTTSSRGCASRAGCPSRGCTSSTTRRRTRSRPAATRKHAAIAVTTGLLEKMNRVELEGVLAHELSHIRNYDILVMTLTVTMVGIIALLSDFFLRFMFWGGGRRGNDNRQQSRRCHHRPLRVRAVDLRADHRPAHAVRGEPAARVPRRRVGRAAHALPARADLGAREAEGRHNGRSTPRRRRPRTSGSRNRSTRRASGRA